MTPISLLVNGEVVETSVEPRMSLGDFVRGPCGLTGTHLGCEHGVCGACTVMVDDRPVRSCLMYAVQAAGSRVRTIEDFDDDTVMGALRSAFTREHALQCGFCTPGMLITARDIATRLDHPSEERIRDELAGNLCRCTGYLGIVKAIASVHAFEPSKVSGPVRASPPGDDRLAATTSAGETPQRPEQASPSEPKPRLWSRLQRLLKGADSGG